MEQLGYLRQPVAWQGEVPTYNIYTLGTAGERFFRELKDHGRFVGTRCAACRLTYIPPRIYCERCFAGLEDWTEVPGQGTVFTYTLAYYDLDDHRLERPEVLAFVQLHGAHGGLVHRLGEVDPTEVRLGMEVEALLKPASERQGSILDILYFRPLRGRT